MDTISAHKLALDNCSDLPFLPEHILSRDQAVIETNFHIWRLTSASEQGLKHLINWQLLDDADTHRFLSMRARHLLKLYLADRISKRKASTVKNNYGCFLFFIRWLISHASAFQVSDNFNWSDISEGLARAFLEWCVEHRARKGLDFVCLRTFYEWGVARGYYDFQQSTLRILQSIKAANNAKGHNVRFRHPLKGPFSSDELFSIRNALEMAKGTEHDRAIVMLHLELGLNPNASVQITNADFKCYETKHLTTYQIDAPRIKKRTIHRETKRRPISSTLGRLLKSLQQGEPEAPLLHWLKFSRPEQSVRSAMRRFVKASGIISPHTQMALNMTPRRFRTSLATHMASQGASKFHIAEILDHTDLQSIDVYTQVTSSIADHVATATDPIVKPLIQRFLGKLADTTEKSDSQEVFPSRIPASAPHLPIPMLNTGGIGSCGKKDGVCRLLPPLSCYLCPCFVAFRQGPHQEMLSTLFAFLQQREEMVDERIKRQLDDVCIAIREVLEQINLPFPNQISLSDKRQKDKK